MGKKNHLLYADKAGYEARQKVRFPQHDCELPFTPNRVHPLPRAIPNMRDRIWLFVVKMVVAWRRNPTLRIMRPSNYGVEVEQARQLRSIQWWLIHPFSRFWKWWQLMVIVSTLALLLLLPYKQAYLHTSRILESGDKPTLWDNENVKAVHDFRNHKDNVRSNFKYLVYVCDGFFIMHIGLLLVTGTYNLQTNRVIMDQRLIMKRYLKTWLLVDLITIIPTETENHIVMGMIYEFEHSYETFYGKLSIFCYSLLYPVRLTRLHYTFPYLMNWFAFYGCSTIVPVVTIFGILLLLFLQWSSYFMVRVCYLAKGRQIFNPNSGAWVTNNFYSYLAVNVSKPLLKQYIVTVHRVPKFVGTLAQDYLSIVITPEDTIVNFIVMWIGNIFPITAIVFAILYHHRLERGIEKIISVYTQMQTYERVHKFPKDLRRRTKIYYNAEYGSAYYNTRNVLESLPANVRRNMKTDRGRNILSGSPLFHDMPKSLMFMIGANLQEAMFLPHDVIYASGSEASYLYFLSIGTVAFYLPDGQEVGHMFDGDLFGLKGLLIDDLRGTNIGYAVALEISQMYLLPRDEFWQLIGRVPRLISRLRSTAMVRYADIASNLRLDKSADVAYSEWVVPPEFERPMPSFTDFDDSQSTSSVEAEELGFRPKDINRKTKDIKAKAKNERRGIARK